MDDTPHSNAGGTQSPKAAVEPAKRSDSRSGGRSVGNGKPASPPEWADGLKRLYDSVVEEPLPDDLASLLARLDEVDGGDAA